MPEPKNYMLNVPNPREKIMAGLGTIPAIQQMKAAQEARKRQQAAMDAVSNLSADSSPEDWMTAANAISLVNPEVGESVRKNFAKLTEEEQKISLQQAGQSLAAIDTNPELARTRFLDMAKAAENSGDKIKAKAYRDAAELIGIDPIAARRAIGTMVAFMPGGDEVLANVSKYGEELRQEDLHEDTRDKMQAEAAELWAKTDKILSEIKRIKDFGGDPDKIFDHEKALRGEFEKMTSPYREASSKYRTLLHSAKDESAAGDVALIFNFMKVLDPNSVVRESEFAVAQNTAALYKQVERLYNRWSKGDRLLPEQRAAFVRLATKYMSESQKDVIHSEQRLQKSIKDYGLDEERVLGPESTRRVNLDRLNENAVEGDMQLIRDLVSDDEEADEGYMGYSGYKGPKQ